MCTHSGTISYFQHDEWKIISGTDFVVDDDDYFDGTGNFGSSEGVVCLWSMETGNHIHDLLTGIRALSIMKGTVLWSSAKILNHSTVDPRRKRRSLRNTKARFLEELEESDIAEALFTDSDDLESLDQYQEPVYQESEYSESIQTVPDYSTLFESSEENSDTTETEVSSTGAQYVISSLDGVTAFTIEGKTFQEGLGSDWHCAELGLKCVEKDDVLYIPMKLLYERKGKEKDEFNDDKD
ncbi:2260_t:CDS:2, partial [Entrophospora sp. SA101]